MKVLLVTWNGGGNVPPALGIASALKEHGHNVVVLGPDNVRTAFEPSGAMFVPLSYGTSYNPYLREDQDTKDSKMMEAGFGGGYPLDFLAALEAHSPELVIIDFCLASTLIKAEELGLNYIILVHTLLGRILPNWDHKLIQRINDLRSAQGLETVETTAEFFARARLVMIASFPKLDDETMAAEIPNAQYVGGVFEPQSQDKNVDSVASLITSDAKQKVLVSFSSVFTDQVEILQRVCRALNMLNDVAAIVTTGFSVDPEEISGGHNVTVTRWVPHSEILSHIDAAVVHAGHSSVTKALSFGVPMLCMPQGVDQYYVAQRVEALGAGLSLSADASDTEIASQLSRILHRDEFRASAKNVQLSIGEKYGNGALLAAGIIESLQRRI